MTPKDIPQKDLENLDFSNHHSPPPQKKGPTEQFIFPGEATTPSALS